MTVERHTHERALQFEAQMAERGFAPVQGQQRRLDILRAAGLPCINGPRPLPGGGVEMNIYTFSEAAMILRHPLLCWHERAAILKRGEYGEGVTRVGDVLRTMADRRMYWAGVLVALALGPVELIPNGNVCHDGTWMMDAP